MTNSIILLDNAAWHKSEETRRAIEEMKIPHIFSAPYSYSTAGIELLFSALKEGELQAVDKPTGKR